MHQETAGPDGFQPFEARRHPILGFERREARLTRDLLAGRQRHEIEHRHLVRCLGEVDLDKPVTAVLLEGRDRRILGIEDLGQRLGEDTSPRLVGLQPQDGGDLVRDEAFAHGERLSREPRLCEASPWTAGFQYHAFW